MSVLKNIWRPEDPPRKGAGPHADSVLTERLAELLGRQLEEMQEQESAGDAPKDSELAPSTNESEPAEARRPAAASVQDSPVAELQDSIAEPGVSESEKNFSDDSSSWQSAPHEPVQGAVDDVLVQLRAFEEQIEAKLRGRAEDYAQALETAVNGLDRGPGPEKALDEMGEQFRTEARGWFDEARRELREQLETSRNALENELKRNHTELLEIAQQKIDSIARESLGSSAGTARQQDQEQTEQWLKEQTENSRRQAEAATQNLTTATEQALGRLRAFEERIEAGFRSQVEEYRRAVESAAGQLEQNGISQAKFQHAGEELQRLTDQALDRSTRKIDEHADQSMSRINQKLNNVEQSLAGAARAAMEGALLEQQNRLSEAWLENSRALVETVTKAGQESQTQLNAARQAAEQEFQNAVREQGRRIMEEAVSELKSSDLQQRLIADVSGEMEQAARETMTRSVDDLKKQSETAVSGLSGTLNQTAEKFLADVQQRLNESGRAWFESAGQSVQREYQSRISQWLDEQTRATRQRAEEAEQSVARLTDQAATRLELVSREAEASLRARVQEQQQRWLESALEEARRNGSQQKVIDQALTELETRAGQLLDQATKQLAEHADHERGTIASEMDASTKKLLEGAEASLEKISWQHRGRLAQWWEERNQMARRESETAVASITQASQQAVSQLRSVQSEMEAEMTRRSREHQTRLLEGAMEEMRRNGAIERAVSEAASTLRTNASEVLVRSTEQIRDQVESARKAMENQAQASRWGLAEELAKKAEQAQLSVEAAGKAVTEDYRRQLSVWWEERTQTARRESADASESVTRAARQATEQLQSARKGLEAEIESGMQSYRKGLRDAAAEELRRQGFQKELLDSIAAELDKSAKELAERSTKELQKHIDTSLSGLDEKMKATRQGLLDDTQKQLADLTRSSMDMTTTRFHELLTRNVQDLEKEQEEWLQRKRESVWLDINERQTSSPGYRQHAMHAAGGPGGKKTASTIGSMLGRVVMGVFVLALAAVLTVVVIRVMPRRTVTMQLSANPPTGFVPQNVSWGPQERARQLRIGQAYWMVAVNDLQHKYAFNTPLPKTPPPDFNLNGTGLRETSAMRMFYWNELRKLWTTPDDWQKVSTTTTGQLTEGLSWLRQKLLTPQTPATPSQ